MKTSPVLLPDQCGADGRGGDLSFGSEGPSEIAMLDDDAATVGVRSSGIGASRPQETSGMSATVAIPDTTAARTSLATAVQHPIYGTLLADFGFKRVYCSSARTLISHVPIWHRQRPVDPSRVAEMAATKPTGAFAGCISVFEMEGVAAPNIRTPQLRGIFDGQHRALAIDGILGNESDAAEPEERDFDVLVEVFPTSSDEDVKRLFLEVNKAQSVQEIDLAQESQSAGVDAKKVITTAVEQLAAEYPAMFSSSQRCRPPHLNKELLRNALYASDVVAQRGLTSATELVELMMQANGRLAELPESRWPVKLHDPHKLGKAQRYNMFLGMTQSWVDEL